MSGNCSQDLNSLLAGLGKSKLSTAFKNGILKQAETENLKSHEPEISNSDIQEEKPMKQNASEIKSVSLESYAEIMNVCPKISSIQSDTESPEHAVREEILNNLSELTEEDDLLCEISVPENETFTENEEYEKFFNVKFELNLEEFEQRNMVGKKFYSSLFEKQKVPALQIGTAIPKPVLSAEEADFSKSVTGVLKNIGFYGPSCIQSVVWPAVVRSRDMFVVAPPHSGKTISYVLPLVSRFTSGSRKNKLENIEPNKGPSLIVLCSSWKKAYAVSEYFKLFLGEKKKKIFILYINGGHYKNKLQSLINNCDILIATPHCLFEFFQDKLVSFARLKEFIVDDGSIIMIKHKKEFKEIILCVLEAIKKTECSPQLIICSERWNKNFQIIVDKVMKRPVLYFTSFLEAAIYAKIPITAHVCDSKNTKKSVIYGIIKDCSQKIVICTTDIKDAERIHLFLLRMKCNSYLLDEDMEHFRVDDVIKCWKAADTEQGSQCLVVTDCVVTDMRISCADRLIHFDVPLKSRLQFGNRFSVIAEYFTKKELSSKCSCHVLILESEHFHAVNLVEIIENSGGVPNEKLVELSKMYVKDDNISADLCNYMKAFGICSKINCEYRHKIVPDVDKPQIVPYEGDIHGIVTHVVDASHYYVRLVKYLDPVSSKTLSLVGVYAQLGFQLRDFYINASVDMKVETPVVGESYVSEEEKLFFRVKILGFVPESSTNLALWKVLYLDEGWIKDCKVLKLYKMTNEINLPKPLAVEVYACNIAPPDSSFDWNPQTSQLVSNLLKEKEIHGKIVLCLGSTLWLDPFAVSVRLSDGHYVYPFKVDQKLLDLGHVIKRKNHMDLLHKACDGKINLPHLTKRKVKEEKIDQPEPTINYAFLDCNVYEDVYVSCVVSPDQLYVQRAKFVECLDDLLEKINIQVEKKTLKKAYSIFKDMICVAPFFEDNRYYRAIVTDLLGDDKVSVFFVDFGDSGTVDKKDIFSISAEFLLLPFQGIECELAGIKAAHGGWTESAISTLTLLSRDDAYDMKILRLKAYSKSSSYSCGNRYVIDLWDNDKKLSEKLLQAGFGVPEDLSTEISNKSSFIESHNSALDLDDNELPPLDDEDMDPEDKKIADRFYETVGQMISKEYNLSPLSKSSDREDSDDEETILKECNLNSLPLSSAKNDNLQNIFPKLDQLKRFLPSSKPPENSVRPLITWWDTPEELNILINLRDIKIYELDVKDESLNFNTIVAGVQYTTDENFYGKINSSDATIEQVVQGIKIISKKRTPFKWPRLTKEKKKFFHIKYDLIHIDDSDSDESTKLNKEKSKRAQDMRYMYDEKESSSTDEEETYVEPWNEFAQYKDPVMGLLNEI